MLTNFSAHLRNFKEMIINQVITVCLVGFNAQETENFSAVLSLAERGLQHIWRISSSMDADLFLLAEGIDFASYQLPQARCLFYSSQKTTDDRSVLLVDTHGVPRLRSVVEVFNRLANELLSAQSPSSNASFNPQHGFLGQLLHAPTQAQAYSLPEQTAIYVDKQANVYFSACDLQQLKRYAKAPQVFATPLTEPQYGKATADLTAKPLNNLIWEITFLASSGKLLQGHSQNDIVHLSHWPDLSIATCRNYMKLIAFMRHNTAPISEIAQSTAIEMTEIYNFYNACYLIGFIEKAKQSSYHQKKHRQHELLNKINSRLKEVSKV